MRITLNGKPIEVPDTRSVLGLIQEKGLDPERVVAEHNGEILAPEAWDTAILRTDDVLELISMVGGG